MARLLGFRPAMLTSVLYFTSDAAKYTVFEVRKKSGDMRSIAAPMPRLKLLQQRLAALLQRCFEERMQAHPHRSSSQFGYLLGKSVKHNADRHRARRYVLNVDLADFFPSINFGRVRGFFISDSGFALTPEIATTIAQIACFNNRLPQGAPSSPIISSLIGGILDRRLSVLAREHGCTYSRYVDDLTFSTNAHEFPVGLAVENAAEDGWTAGPDLLHAVEKAGFAINAGKTRLFARTGRQTVTGLVVNRKVNVDRRYEMRVRAAFHRWCREGTYSVPGSLERTAAGEPPEQEGTVHRLEGMLQWIYDVRDFADTRKDAAKRNAPSSFRKLYREFLFAKHCLFMDRPLVICEGKTDNVYIEAALKKLAASYPTLASWEGDEFRRLIRTFRYNHKSLEVMRLGGGSGDMTLLVRDYRRFWSRLARRPPAHPVVMVVDNDDGGKAVFKAVKDVGGPVIAIEDPGTMFHAFDNLFIVKTPQGSSASKKSCIEDLFDVATLARTVGGKTFNPSFDGETKDHFGKHVFAEAVVRPHWQSIDFSGFKPLLDAIADAIASYP